MLKPFEPAIVKAKVAVFVELFQSRRLLRDQLKALETLSTRLQAEIQEKAALLKAYTEPFDERRPLNRPPSVR